MSRRRSKKRYVKWAVSLTLTGVVLALVVYFSVSREASSSPKQAAQVGIKEENSTSGGETAEKIVVSGIVGGVEYYHCSSSPAHLVLLHGAAFSKEDWKTSGILDKFCAESGISVSAMDLPVSAGHTQLKSLLVAMEEANLLQRPVVLVTPSASGRTIIDWIMNGDVSEIQQSVSKWIPVAAGSISSASDAQVSSLNGILPTFAIYGNRDTGGRRVSERLVSLAGAKILEIEGGHPAYLDSPDDFVTAVLQDLGFDT